MQTAFQDKKKKKTLAATTADASHFVRGSTSCSLADQEKNSGVLIDPDQLSTAASILAERIHKWCLT